MATDPASVNDEGADPSSDITIEAVVTAEYAEMRLEPECLAAVRRGVLRERGGGQGYGHRRNQNKFHHVRKTLECKTSDVTSCGQA